IEERRRRATRGHSTQSRLISAAVFRRARNWPAMDPHGPTPVRTDQTKIGSLRSEPIPVSPNRGGVLGRVGGFVLQRPREIEEAAARTFTKVVVSTDQFQRLFLRKNVSRDQIAVVGRSTRGRR